MSLADLIQRERDPLIREWARRAYATMVADQLPFEDVVDELREFLDELCACMRRDGGADGDRPPLEMARRHGRQRFHIGYDMSGVVREHGLLADCLHDLVERSRYAASVVELRSLSRFLSGALADSATAYSHERDRELREQTERYVGFLAHELRNAVGTARLAFSTLAEGGLVPAGPATDSLARSLARMNQLVDTALIEMSTRTVPQAQPVTLPLADFLGEVVADSRAEAIQKGVSVELVVERDIAVRADPRLLGSAVSNLVRNGVKFSRAGGTVILEGKLGQGHVTIAVTDSCGGLPPGSVERLFNPFVQAGVDRSGFGLGLAIAKQAAEAHGGDIRVHDIPGSGCVFVIDLPTPLTPASNR